ncbi:MAG: glutamate--tRNA ligase [Acidobacteriota bacterium]
MSTRVRFAPSPTGYLHIGGARTALFNHLFARQTGGTFILRIEDTDAERSSPEMADGILRGLTWLELDWDEGPIFQSQRRELYHQVAQGLLEEGHAYRCFCTAQQLEERKAASGQGARAWSYDRLCRRLDGSEARRRAQAGQAHVLRLKVPTNRKIRFTDWVYGKVEVDSQTVEDFILLRSVGMPTYHLAVVADDSDLQITHVIRGADHLGNTVKHLLIYQALGIHPPHHAHLPLILGQDRKRLSKRHGAMSVLEFSKQGFLPAAMRNYLALLGWSPKSNQEIYQGRDLTQAFDLKRVNKADAVFDRQKLEWLNGKYLSAQAPEELEASVRQALQAAGLWKAAYEDERRQWFLEVIQLLQPRMKTFPEFADLGRAYFSDDFEYDPAAVERFLPAQGRSELAAALEGLHSRYSALHPFDLGSSEATLRETCHQHQIKPGALIGAVRVALTGHSVAPSIFEVIVRLGQQVTVDRLGRVIQFLR